MSIQQTEGENLGEKSMVMRRQALRRTVASVPRRDRLASILVVLLIGTWLLGTPTFGASEEEIRGYGTRRMLEGVQRMVECTSVERLVQPSDTILKCQAEGYRIFEEGLQWCLRNPLSCAGIEEPPKAPVPVSCPESSIPIEYEEEDGKPKLRFVRCPEGYMDLRTHIPIEFEEDGKIVIEVCNPIQVTDPQGNPLPEPDPGCVLGYDEDSQQVVHVCNPIQSNPFLGCTPEQWAVWPAVWKACMYEADRENRRRCAWRHPFYTSEYIKGAMWVWEKHTVGEAALCLSGCAHHCVPAAAGFIFKKAFK